MLIYYWLSRRTRKKFDLANKGTVLAISEHAPRWHKSFFLKGVDYNERRHFGEWEGNGQALSPVLVALE